MRTLVHLLGTFALAGLIVAASVTPAAAQVGGSCDDPGGNLDPPSCSCLSLDGMTTLSVPSDFYAVDLVAGVDYVFTLCDNTCSGAGGDYDTRLRLYDPSCGLLINNDDACGLRSEIQVNAPVTGTYVLEVTGFNTSSVGSYTLGWREATGQTSCSSPDGVLNVPTTSCQLQPGPLDCGDDAYYQVTLTQGQNYTFTLCDGTCTGANAGFDSEVELFDPNGVLVASDGAACGDDGEVVYQTDSLTGGGTYCVHVRREAGSEVDFDLGYRVTCQPPSDMTLTPDTAGTQSDDCTLAESLTATVGGTGVFDWTWQVLPTPPNTATPDTFSESTQGNTSRFDTLLDGVGDYTIVVTASNECGTLTEEYTYTLTDARGPDIVCSAEPCDSSLRDDAGTSQQLAAEPGSWNEPMQLDRELIRETLLSHSDNEQARKALAEKLDLMPEQVMVYDTRDPQFMRQDPSEALSCANPCTFGDLVAFHPYYDVVLDCDNGAFTARTGDSHSVTISSGDNQNVIFGGRSLSPGTSDITFHVHDTGENYLDPFGGQACAFDPPDTAAEPMSTGIEAEWTRTTANGAQLTLREEIVAFGDTEPNSGVRMTLGVSNSASSPTSVNMGVRWQIDYQNAGDDGPLYAPVTCSPFEIGEELFTEHELLPDEIEDFYRIQNNTSTPIFGNFTNTTSIQGFPDTGLPDRLIYGSWPSMTGSDWDYITNEGDPNPDFDSAVLYYFGYAPADGIVLQPGESFTRSVVIFTAGDAQSCGGFTPGTGADDLVEICPGDCASVGATATDNCDDDPSVALIESSVGAPACTSNPCEPTFDTPGVYEYQWEAVDDSGNATTCTSTVVVLPVDDPRCNQPPECDAGGPYTDTCNEVTVDGATAEDPNGDDLTYTWTSDRPDVTVNPNDGNIPGGSGLRPVPPSVATLDPRVPACGESAVLTLEVDDGNGGVSSCETTVTFDDTIAPQLNGVPADANVECDAVPPAPQVTASDNCDPNPQLVFDEQRIDGNCEGNYTLIRTWTATDACGNTTTATQTLEVRDTTPPTVDVANQFSECLWPPNHWYVCLDTSDLQVTASDNCSAVSFDFAGCSSNQPDDARESDPDSPYNGDGHTTDDCILVGDRVCARAERAGAGPDAQDGRYYGVLIVAEDSCGNVSDPLEAGSIHVPHDQSPAEKDCLNPTKVGIKRNQEPPTF